MNRTSTQALLAILLSCACAQGSLAQEAEAAKAKQAVPKAQQEAKAKYREKKRQAKAKAKAEAEAKAVDLNHATREQLKQLPGLTEAQVDAIIAKRPHTSKADLVTKGIIPAGTFQSLRKQIAAR